MTIKTQTPGIYQVHGKKKGKVKYRLYINVRVTNADGVRWKLKSKTFAKYQDAVDTKVKTQAELKSGKYVEPSNVSVKELVAAWVEAGKTKGVSKRGPWKIQTQLSNTNHLRLHIAPKLGDQKASKLRKSIIEGAAAEWAKATSPETANKVLASLNAAYKWALKDPDRFGIGQNPLVTVERLASRQTPEEIEEQALGIADHGEDQAETTPGVLREIQPDEVYTALELKKILNAARPGFEKTLLMVAVFCGLRHGELAAIRWPVIDLKRKTLTINRSLTQLSKEQGGSRLERPKTRKGYRVIELPAPLVAELRQWKLQCTPNPNQLVFVNELGRPPTRQSNNRVLKSACKRAGVRALSMNNLRHSFASQQLIHGTAPLEVSYLMGHSSPAVTLSIYSHWTKREKSHAQERLASSILGAVEEGSEEAAGETV